MEIEIKEARIEEAEQIAQLQIAMAWESEALALNPDTVNKGVKQLLANKQLGTYYLSHLSNTGEIIGCMMVTKEWSDWNNSEYWWLQSVYVRKEFRRKGVFTQMCKWLENEARKQTVKALRLYVDETNAPAQACYDNLGLKSCHYLIREKVL